MDKIQIIKNRLLASISLTDEELLVFGNAFELKKLSRNEFFLKEGEICDFIGLVIEGVLIYTKYNEKGDEITTDFAFEGDWANNNRSRLTNTPSTINIKAIDHSGLLVIKQKALNDLYIQIPKVERLGRLLMEQAYVRLVEQTIDLQVLSAKERYENLLKKHPQIVQKAQQYHVANYLGIAPKSLSRIRKEISE